MRKSVIYSVIVGVILVLVFGFGFINNENVEDFKTKPVPVASNPNTPISNPSVPVIDQPVNFESYNYAFADDENVKARLNNMLGSNGRTAFYLPRTGYINVSRGSSYGVVYALNNPVPSGENYFEYNWNVDPAVVSDCGVSVEKAQKWIERGWKSWGKIPKGWIDHMTVYFVFPADIEPCTVRYNFVINKDGKPYDSKILEFNLI